MVTTFGSPWWFVRVIAGDPGRKAMMRGVKPMCARDVKSFWLAQYDLDHADDDARHRFLTKVRRRLAAV